MYKPRPLTETEKAWLDAFLKQIGTQAALLAGFTFGILTTIEYQAAPRRSFWFVITAVVTIALELLAATLSSSLVFLTKLEKTEMIFKAFRWQTIPALGSYLTGVLTFIATLDLFVWIKYIVAAPSVTVILCLAVVLGLFLLVHAVMTHDRIAEG